MMRSLFAGVSGLRNQQTAMDVIGNNIANVNTVAFKGSRVTFKEAFAQLLQGASRPPGDIGGVNPIQIGSGMNIGSIDQLFTQGSLQSTGQNTDLAIQGNSFFVLGDGAKQVFTRAGNFQLDADGRLINPNNGFTVQGINADALGNFSAASSVTDIKLPLGQKSPAQPTTTVNLTGNLDQNAVSLSPATSPTAASSTLDPGLCVAGTSSTLNAVGGAYTLQQNVPGTVTLVGPGGASQTLTGLSSGAQTLNFASLGVSITTNATFNASAIKGPGTLNAAALNVSSNAVAAASQSMGITVYDAAGAAHNLQITMVKQAAPGAWAWSAVVSGSSGAITAGSSGTATFGGTGTLTTFTPTSLTVTPANGSSPPFTFALNPGTIGQFDGLAGFARQSNAVISSQNGYQAGDLSNLAVDKTGTITGFFTNGVSRALAKLSLASFNNPSGLLRTGDNIYQASANSGGAVLGFSGTTTSSTVTPGALENSNVDISQEFTNMITTQRGFQANARVITTSDEMLQELVNLKR